jgi:hypothetical protein
VFKLNAPIGWTTELHNLAGNVGLSDGSVQQMTSARIAAQLGAQTNATIRLLIP